jgi:hypothetical protein
LFMHSFSKVCSFHTSCGCDNAEHFIQLQSAHPSGWHAIFPKSDLRLFSHPKYTNLKELKSHKGWFQVILQQNLKSIAET